MQMDSRIILAGQPVNALQALDAGTRAAGNAAQVGRTADLWNLYRDQGAGIMSGDQNALRALAGLDPMAALGVQETQQGMRIREEQLQLARAAGARAAQQHVASLDAAQAAQERAQIEQGLMQVAPLLQRQDLNGINQAFRTFGLPPVQTIEDAYGIFAQYEGAYEVYNRIGEMMNDPQADDAMEREIQRTMQTLGLSREQATAIAYGVVGSSRDPVTGEQGYFDLRNAFGDQQPTPTNAPAPGQNFPSVFNQDQPAPATQPAPQPTTTRVDPVMPEDADYRGALGLEGLVTGALNSLVDFAVGRNLFPSQREAATAMDNLATRTILGFASAVAGRPSNYLLEMYERIVVRPRAGSGPEGALDVATQTMALIRQGIQENRDVLGSRVTPATRSEAQRNILRLEALLQDYEILVNGLTGNGGNGRGNTTSSGVTWEIVE